MYLFISIFFFTFLKILYYEVMRLTQKSILFLLILPFKNEIFSIPGIDIPGMLSFQKNEFIKCNFLHPISNNVKEGFLT